MRYRPREEDRPVPFVPSGVSRRAGGPWRVTYIDGLARHLGVPETSLLQGESKVPGGYDPDDRANRIHEYLHIAYSPHTPEEVASTYGLPLAVVQVAEDARLNLILQTRRLRRHKGPLSLMSNEVLDEAWRGMSIPETGQIVRLLLERSPDDALCFVLASLWGPDEQAVDDALADGPPSTAARRAHLRNKFHEWWDEGEWGRVATDPMLAVKVARDFLDGWEMATAIDTTSGFEGEILRGAVSGLEAYGVTPDPEALEALLGESHELDHLGFRQGAKPDPSKHRSTEPIRWGKMERRDVPLTKRVRLQKAGRRWRPSDDGVVPRYFERWPSDKKVFTRKKRQKGGTVLLDMSGSMSLSEEEVRMLVEAAPAVTVAGYSGSGPVGELVILARNGRIAEDLRPRYGGNEVDMPALQWLARQSRPLMWVSDGHAVPYKGDYEEAMRACANFAIRNRILRVPTVADAIEAFKRWVL
jgi:hypothetical protein